LENIDGATGDLIETGEKESVSSALNFSPGQILFPKLRPYLNKTHRATISGLCSTEFYVFDVHGITAEFLAEFLRSQATVAVTSLLMTGNTLPRLQLADIKQLQIPVPPEPVQEKIAAEIKKSAPPPTPCAARPPPKKKLKRWFSATQNHFVHDELAEVRAIQGDSMVPADIPIFIWWRRRELNPRPKSTHQPRLHAYPG